MRYDPVTENMYVVVLVVRLLLSLLAVMNSREASGIKLTLKQTESPKIGAFCLDIMSYHALLLLQYI